MFVYNALKVGDLQGAATVARMPGQRVKGGVYVEVACSPDGKPLEAFLYDPPVEMTFEAQKKNGIKPNRVSLVPEPGDGAVHLVDWVGQHFYPNVADILEEGRRFGFSRRCELHHDQYARLSPQSLLILVHAKGYLANWSAYGPSLRPCPKAASGAGSVPDGHAVWGPDAVPPPTMCAAYWWNDIVGGMPLAASNPTARALSRACNRTLEPGGLAWSYGTVFRAPDDMAPRYIPAMVARLPIGKFVVVRDDGPEYEAKLAAVRLSGFPVEEVPE